MELRQIQLIVETYFDLKINVKSRRRDIVDARKMYFGLCKNFTNYGLVQMGYSLNKNHATALYNIVSCKDLRQTDIDFDRKYLALYKKISFLQSNKWKPKTYTLPKVIHPGILRHADKKSIRKIFNKRRSITKQRYELH